MNDQLKIAVIQSNLIWEDPKSNRKRFKEKIREIDSEVDIIILPEMFTSGFTMNAEKVAESMDGKTVLWMKKRALKANAAIIGSIVIKEHNN